MVPSTIEFPYQFTSAFAASTGESFTSQATRLNIGGTSSSPINIVLDDITLDSSAFAPVATALGASSLAATTSAKREVAVPVSFVVDPSGEVSFALGAYDSTQPLTIDPTLIYSTYLGGSGDDTGIVSRSTRPEMSTLPAKRSRQVAKLFHWPGRLCGQADLEWQHPQL